MVALILNALFIVAFDLGIKAATMRKIDTSTMACVSYLFAVAFASVWLVLRQPIEIGWASAGFGVLNGVTYIGGL
ncbi:MAG: hypothetical protein O3A46_07695, partial [Candidatus Poribacteria bacterium]|nr:hypothetical protein [Candidatus Poribacteria bacterium]